MSDAGDRILFDIWLSDATGLWCAQLVNFIGHFKSQEQAQRYVDGVKKYREQDAAPVASKKGKKK